MNGANHRMDGVTTYEVVEMSDMLLELVSTIHIIVVGIVADDDMRVLHHVLDEAEAWNLRIRKSLIGIGSVFYLHKFLYVAIQIIGKYLLFINYSVSIT